MSFSRKKRPTRRRRWSAHAPAFERLEDRNLLTATPFGATEMDTGEYLLGSIYVSVVAFESDGSRDANLEDWSQSYRNEVKANVQQGLQWWEDTLDIQFPNHQHDLNFQIDFTYLDAPIATGYEPISRPSYDFQLWTGDFFDHVGFNSGDFSDNSRAFNHAQREAHDTDWAFTIFVVNDEADPDGSFAPGGFSRAFAFAGGRFFVIPAGRPESTYTHEAGHMFWGKDEYRGGGSYLDNRGYYDAQNFNAWDNPVFLSGAETREPSIMDRGACDEGGGLLCTAFEAHTTSDSSFAMIGWVDSDGDGIFDVLDVPLTLNGVGSYNAARGEYQFVGNSTVVTSPNLNSSGPQSDITVNQVSQAQYRINGGTWIEAQRYDAYTANLNLTIPLAAGQQIEIRTIDDRTSDVSGVASPIFVGNTTDTTTTLLPGINGFVWNDLDGNGQWDSGEAGLPGKTIRLVDPNGVPLSLAKGIDPDDYPSQSTLLNNVIPEVTLSAIGNGTFDDSVVSIPSPNAGTTGRVFANFCGGFCSTWTKESRRLRMDFTELVSTVSIDAIGKNVDDVGRLEIYDANDNLLARYTTGRLAVGQAETMTLNRPTAEIAYAIAGAFSDRTILLDNLEFGPRASAVTDSRGVYRLPYLEPGSYDVEIVPEGDDDVTSPVAGTTTVTLTAGQAVGNIDFGVTRPTSRWQNPSNKFDVNNDTFLSPNDVLLIINVLNSAGPHVLADEPAPPYLDVNGDGLVTSNDALQVINQINSQRESEGESGSFATPRFSPQGSRPEAEGPLQPQRGNQVGYDGPAVGLGPASGDPLNGVSPFRDAAQRDINSARSLDWHESGPQAGRQTTAPQRLPFRAAVDHPRSGRNASRDEALRQTRQAEYSVLRGGVDDELVAELAAAMHDLANSTIQGA